MCAGVCHLTACGTKENSHSSNSPIDTRSDSGIEVRPLPPPNPNALTRPCDERPRLGQWPDANATVEAPDHDLSGGVLDPNAMYFAGSQSPGLCNGQLAWVYAPDEPGIAVSCLMESMIINPATRRVAYFSPSPKFVHEVQVDPEATWGASDVDVELPEGCDLITFRIAPDGTYAFQCGETWKLADGTEFYSGESTFYDPARRGSRTVVHLGCRGYALLGNGVLEMHTGNVAELPPELADKYGVDLVATRAGSDGFWAALGTRLLHIAFDGTVTALGEYPSTYENRWLYSMGADGALYHRGFPNGTIFRSTPDGNSESLYEEGEGLIETTLQQPVTGP